VFVLEVTIGCQDCAATKGPQAQTAPITSEIKNFFNFIILSSKRRAVEDRFHDGVVVGKVIGKLPIGPFVKIKKIRKNYSLKISSLSISYPAYLPD